LLLFDQTEVESAATYGKPSCKFVNVVYGKQVHNLIYSCFLSRCMRGAECVAT